MDIEEKILAEFPEPNAKDTIYQFLLILLGATGQVLARSIDSPADIPVSNLMSARYEPPVTKRRNEWLKNLAEKFELLFVDVQELKKNNSFNQEELISLLMHSLPIAIKNHQKEKLDALANIVVNSATTDKIDEDIKFMMLSLVDRITSSHILALKTFDSRWQNENNFHGLIIENGVIRDFDKSFPAFKGNKDFFFLLVKELMILNLLREKPEGRYLGGGVHWQRNKETGTHEMTSKNEVIQEYRFNKQSKKERLAQQNALDIGEIQLTNLGRTFIKFISNSEGNIEIDNYTTYY